MSHLCVSPVRPIEPRVMRNHYRTTVGKVPGADKVCKFHAMRHTFASLLTENGVDVKTVSSLLGHSAVSITLNVYVHPSAEQKTGAANRVFKKFL